MEGVHSRKLFIVKPKMWEPSGVNHFGLFLWLKKILLKRLLVDVCPRLFDTVALLFGAFSMDALDDIRL